MSEISMLPGSAPDTVSVGDEGVKIFPKTSETSILVELQNANEEIALLRQKLAQRDEKIQQLTDENTSLKESVFIDSTTGCYNDKFLKHFIEENFDPQREDGQLSTIYFDVNGLKPINDTLGHDVGDELIRHATTYLKSLFRDEDLVIRLHGDEFLVICKNNNGNPDFSQVFPLVVSQRITSTSQNGFIFGDRQINYSFAAGIAVFDRTIDGDDLNRTIKRADDLMYQNKQMIKTSTQANFSPQDSINEQQQPQ